MNHVPIERRWYSTPSGWRHADVRVGVGEPFANEEIRVVEMIFLACVVLSTSFSITHALIAKRR